MKMTDNKQAKEDANEEIYQELINMNIHDVITLHEGILVVIRVFGGWIYESHCEHGLSSSFVPDDLGIPEVNARVRIES